MKNNTMRKQKKLLIWITAILAVPVIVAIGLYLFLPLIIEGSAPSLARLYCVSNFEMSVENFSWDYVDIRDIKAGSA